jgi:predicted metal-dependent hydrolase
MQKEYIDKNVGKVRLVKRFGTRRISLRVSARGGVTVTIPYFVPFREGLEFFMAKRDWVLKAQERQKERIGNEYVPSSSEIEALRAEAKAVLPNRLAELAGKYGFHYNQVRIKHNSSNWGSCSAKGNINLNLNLMRVPEELRDYVMLHELCHLRYMNHGPQFHALLESVCPGHRNLQQQLKKHKLI